MDGKKIQWPISFVKTTLPSSMGKRFKMALQGGGQNML